MARKQTEVSRAMLLTWFTLAGLIFLFAPQTLTNKFQFTFTRIFRWPLSIGRNFTLSARTQQPLTDIISRRESQYQNHIANLREELLQERQKVKKLSGLYNRYVWEGVKFVLADVITVTIDKLSGKLIINRGQIDGLAKGQFVLGDNSIIGTISEVSSRTAQVKLITDSTSKIAVKIAGVGRVMQGNGNTAKVPLLPIRYKVKTGDVVLADKKPGFLDAPVIAGKVAQCKRDDENPSLWDITVKPVCDIERLKDVAVIIMNPQE